MLSSRASRASVEFAKRPQGSRLARLLRPGDIVIAAKLDRMFRSLIDGLTVIRSFKDRRISLWLLDLGGDVSGNGISELVFTILGAFAKFEHDRGRERILEGQAEARRQGKFPGGIAPFGSRLVEGKLVPDPEQQRAIAEMPACTEGLSLTNHPDRGAAASRFPRPTVQQALARHRRSPRIELANYRSRSTT